MVGDTPFDRHVRDRGGPLPSRERHQAPTGPGLDQIVRSARADLARLALELRVVSREAEVAERSGRSANPPDSGHLAGREHLRTALVSSLASRRSEHAAEIERARADAARVVGEARSEANEVVAAARDRLSQVRRDHRDGAAILAVSHRNPHYVLVAPRSAARAPTGRRLLGHPALESTLGATRPASELRRSLLRDAPYDPDGGDPALPVDQPACVTVKRATAVPTAAPRPEPPLPATPIPSPAPAIAQAIAPPPVHAMANAIAEAIAEVVAESAAPIPAPHATPAAPAAAPVPTRRPRTGRVQRPRPVRSHRSWLLHADVLVPLIAGIAVLVLLVAGLG